jgi:alpha-galactosidase
VRVEEVALFAGGHQLDPGTPFYGEGFQMLSQTAGTLGAASNLSRYSDPGHYKLPQPEDALTVYSLASLSPQSGHHLLLCFTSSRRFAGSCRFWPDRYEIVVDVEGLTLAPGETWELEEFFCAGGPDRADLLDQAAAAIEQNHPRRRWESPPTGWCSWYFYGPRVSEQDILASLEAIKRHGAVLPYVQIDDGYQSYIGDWLIPGRRFPSGMPALCRMIRDAGFEPAIWVAPFSAERGSRLVEEHPDWLIQDDSGAPLLSSEISFGGWRNGPWYMLDGTHPETQAYLEEVFRTMREEWGCHYFKLDALMWGAMRGGRRHDPAASRIDAYRQGMAALRRGAGEDSFILGCNAPMWASLGEVHGMRVSNDVSRSWRQLSLVARETFWRNWQHHRLWINDPDCILLANADGGRGPSTVTPDEFGFHAAVILASGGMVLSGDDLTSLRPEKWAILEKLLPPAGVAARFEDTSWQTGWIDLPDSRLLCLFNWDDAPVERQVELGQVAGVQNFWTGEAVEIERNTVPLSPHAARVLRILPA